MDPAAGKLRCRRVALYASRETHHTVERAATVLGLAVRKRVVT